MIVSSLKYFRNSWFGEKDLAHSWHPYNVYEVFKWCWNPDFGGMKGMRFILARISYIKSRSIANSWRHLKWCFQKFEEKKRKRNVNVHCTLTCDVHLPPLVHVRVVMGGRGGLVPIFIGGPFKVWSRVPYYCLFWPKSNTSTSIH